MPLILNSEESPMLTFFKWLGDMQRHRRTGNQSCRHREDFGGLSPQNRLQAPQIETWDTINQLRFCHLLEC